MNIYGDIRHGMIIEDGQNVVRIVLVVVVGAGTVVPSIRSTALRSRYFLLFLV